MFKASLLKVLFLCISDLEFMVLNCSIPRMIIIEGKNSESKMTMFGTYSSATHQPNVEWK
jgi:hypothetical protein